MSITGTSLTDLLALARRVWTFVRPQVEPLFGDSPLVASQPELFRCPDCELTSMHKRGLSVHSSHQHKKGKTRPNTPRRPRTKTQPLRYTEAAGGALRCQLCPFITTHPVGMSVHQGHIHGAEFEALAAAEHDATGMPASPGQQRPPLDLLLGDQRRVTRLETAAQAAAPPTEPARTLPETPPEPSCAHQLASLKQSHRVLPRIPQAARNLAAALFSRLLGEVATSNLAEPWRRLLEFPHRVLHVDPAARSESLAAAVRRNISNYNDDPVPVAPTLGR